ncbi:MAG: lipase family protein [Cellvibrio sp.]
MKINPFMSAVLADAVYKINDAVLLHDIVADIRDKFGDNFVVPKATVNGSYGMGVAKVSTKGGLLIMGKNQLKGHAFIIFRGTQLVVDWGTNLNIGTQSINSGLVHEGFYKAVSSMKDQVREFVLKARNDGAVHFHCIGHSLGGAIATLCVDWLKSALNVSAYLYTFGAARPGLSNFANKFNRQIATDRIHRVYHTGDIVPLIAPWPFVHAPNSRISGKIVAGGVMPGVEWHSMTKYIESVKKHSWKTLITEGERPFSATEIENWMLLAYESTSVGFTLGFIERVSAAIKHLMLNVLKGLVGGLTKGISTGFTWYDFVAMVFKKGLALKGRAAELVFGLMNKLLRAMGLKVIADAGELTRDKIRHVFMTFNARINHMVYQAVNHTLAGGKAI